MGLFVINGATAGGFSPISVFGSIVNGVVENANLAENATLLFVSSFVFNLLLSVVVFFLFGGRKLLGHGSIPTTSPRAMTRRSARAASSAASRSAAEPRSARRSPAAPPSRPTPAASRSSTATRS